MFPAKIEVNVSLSEEEKELIKEEIINKRNRFAACRYVGLDARTFKKIMEGAVISSTKKQMLLDMCELIKSGKTAA